MPPGPLVRGLLAATLIAAGGVLSGCAVGTDSTTVGAVPDDYRTRHPIVVSQKEISEDIVVTADARDLPSRDRDVAGNFALRFKRSGANSLAIMIPSGSRNEAAARRIAYQIAGIMKSKGVSESQIYVHHYRAAGYGEAATVRMVYMGLKASVPDACGQWNENIAETSENRNYANFGCATQKNLAAMVASPADLLGPRGESEIDPARRTKIITDWQANGSGTLPTLFTNN